MSNSYRKELAGRSGKAAGCHEIHSERLGEDGRKSEESSAAGFEGKDGNKVGSCKAEGQTAASFRPSVTYTYGLTIAGSFSMGGVQEKGM